MFSHFSQTSKSRSPEFANSSSLMLLRTSTGRILHCPATLRGQEPPNDSRVVGPPRFKLWCLLLLVCKAKHLTNLKILSSFHLSRNSLLTSRHILNRKRISQESRTWEQQFALLTLLSFGASTVGFKRIIVSCENWFPTMFDLLLYVELIYWVTALPLHLRCSLTSMELPCSCTHHSPRETELLRDTKRLFLHGSWRPPAAW